VGMIDPAKSASGDNTHSDWNDHNHSHPIPPRCGGVRTAATQLANLGCFMSANKPKLRGRVGKIAKRSRSHCGCVCAFFDHSQQTLDATSGFHLFQYCWNIIVAPAFVNGVCFI
jgi:hypothetical protein